MTQQIDSQVREMFTKLEQRKQRVSELTKATNEKWKTNGAFRLIGATSTTNLSTSSTEQIHEVLAHVHLLQLGFAKGAEALELSQDAGFKIQGYSVADWTADVKKRLAMIDIREETRKLEELEKRLTSVLSPEERRRIEVELLMKDLAG